MYSNSIESRAGSVLMRTNLNEDEEIIRDFLYCMVSCHGLTHVRGEMVGDPLEMKIFESTKWVSHKMWNHTNFIIIIDFERT